MAGGDRVSSPAQLRQCTACNSAPATHIVSLALEPKVPTGILPNLCLSCACVRAEEKQIARLTADANRVNGAVKEATRRCTRCHKLLAPTSPNTRHDVDYHKSCYAAEQDEAAATRVLAPEQGSPLAGLIGVGR